MTWEQWLENRLRVLRAERGWSQAELGGRLGVSRQAVNAPAQRGGAVDRDLEVESHEAGR